MLIRSHSLLYFPSLPRQVSSAGDGWTGGSAAAGGSAVGSGELSSRMILVAGALRFRALEDSAMSGGGAGADVWAGGDGYVSVGAVVKLPWAAEAAEGLPWCLAGGAVGTELAGSYGCATWAGASVFSARAEDGVLIAAECGHGSPAVEGRDQHEVPFNDCVPQLHLWHQVRSADGAEILAGDVPLHFRLAECILN
ncbi:hypothetical protein V6N12_009338 [Hibiscus sabdariffa]|uniref:Uncharacterized protein n=1 Tax=Hibiscus sabdariffa TaxID=183260 RepID=A0ABR2E9B9_9ROSI